MSTASVADAPRTARYGREVKTLAEARRQFARKRSPWMILTAIAAVATLRLIVGDLGWRDAVAVVAMLVVYPFGEWAIHVYLLHMKPVRIAGRRIEPPAARDHREHHEQPNDLGLILLAPKELAQLLLLAVPVTVALGAVLVGLAAGPVPLGALLSATLAGYCAIFVYEWTHFLIHTAHRPRSRYYRAIWRNHRLHHFKNEDYWHGITNNVSDRVLGTNPEQADVPRSRTARTLDPGPVG
jgi:sterol desaturase/sphingolipid hydroxylase (fatty acid hydroxylase superfamily)